MIGCSVTEWNYPTMTAERFNLRNVDLREVFPWLHLFRSFSLALDAKKIALGAAGALLMSVFWWGTASLFVGDEPTPPVPLPSATAEEQARAVQDYERRLRAYELHLEARR